MPAKEQGKQHAEPAKRTHEQRNGVIIGQLMQVLGRLAAPSRVEVRHLWDNHYRANVFVGATIISTRIAQRFFLTADEDGNIVASTPDLTKS
jgi:hypothetical protein